MFSYYVCVLVFQCVSQCAFQLASSLGSVVCAIDAGGSSDNGHLAQCLLLCCEQGVLMYQ